jgi:hypothetical protein
VTATALTVAIFATVTGMLASALVATDNIQRWAYALAVMTAVPPLVFVRCSGRRVNALSPAAVFGAAVLLGYVLPVAAFADDRDLMSAFVQYPYADKPHALVLALQLATAGIGAFWLGHVIVPPVGCIRESKSARWSGRGLQFIVITYVILGLGLFGAGVVAIGGPSELIAAQGDRLRAFSGINIVQGAQLLPLAWLIVLRRRLDRDGPVYTPVFLSAGVVALLPTLLLGTKVVLFFTLTCTAILHSRLRRRIRAGVVVMVATLGIALASVYDLYFREYLPNEGFTSFVYEALTPAERVSLLFERTLGGQFMQLQMLAISIDAHATDLLPARGATFLPLFTQLIPRKLYPAKPTTPAGMFTERLRPDLMENGTTFPPSFMGELYWNGGAMLLLLGMFGLGLGVGFLERWRARDTPVRSLVGAATVVFLPFLLRGDFSDAAVAWFVFALPLAVGASISTRTDLPV